MFSIPWTHGSDGDGGVLSSVRGSDAGVYSTLVRVRRLNDHLSKRARRLLEERTRRLGDVRGEDRSATGELGSCSFNVALINRMEPSEARPDLKLEPTFGRDRCGSIRISRVAMAFWEGGLILDFEETSRAWRPLAHS